MTTQDRSVLGHRLARPLDELEISRISGAGFDIHNLCAYPYMDTIVEEHGSYRLVCDPCDDVGFP